MSFRDWTPAKEISNPRGMWSVLANRRKGSPARASYMQNSRVNPGVQGSRVGTSSTTITTAGKVPSIFNWIQPPVQPIGGPYSGNPSETFGLLIAQIDVPFGPEQYIFTAGPVTFFGWAIAGPVNTITSVQVAADHGLSYVPATYGTPRPDVATAYPGQAGAPNLGWQFNIDLTGFSIGAHTMFVLVEDSAANSMILSSTYYVTRPPGPEQNLVLYQDGNTLRRYRQSDANNTLLLSDLAGSRSLSFADLDVWTYIAGYDTEGNGTLGAQTYDGFNIDPTFRGPITIQNVSYPGITSGNCSIGIHYFGVIYQNRSGYAGKPTTTVGPYGGTSISVTLSSPSSIDLLITIPTQPDGGENAQVFLVMTRGDDQQNWYYVDNNSQTGQIGQLPMPAGVGVSLRFRANISDADLAASADSANNAFNLLSADANGNPPFKPSSVCAYGLRMVYVAGVQAYISEINNPQSITADQHVISTPNRRKIGHAFTLSNSPQLFLTGDKWTVFTQDNNDIPVTWPPPIYVSGGLGAPFPGCVCSDTGANYAWIVTEGGPYRFTGTYESHPLTYLVGDLWKRVNWKAAYAIKCVDDYVSLKLYVAVPLDGATELNAMFVIDYTNGLAFNQVDVSLDFYNPAVFSAIAVVKEFATALTNIWFGPSSAGVIARYDTASHNDQGMAIDNKWESGLVRNTEFKSSMIRIGGGDVWVRGEGELIITVYGPDHQIILHPPLLRSASQLAPNLSPAPGLQYLFKVDLSKIENCTVEFRTNAIGAWYELSMVRPYLKSDLYNR